MRAEVTVRNDHASTGIQSRVRFLMDRNQSTIGPFEVDKGFSSSQEIPSGDTRKFSFPITLAGSGNQFYTLEVESRINGKYTRTDSWRWTPTFEAVGSLSSFSGVVIDAETSTPLVGAVVTWGNLQAVSDSGGRYEFSGFPCESRTLTVTLTGYQNLSELYEPVCGSSSTKDVSLERTGQVAPSHLVAIRIASGVRLSWVHTATGESGFEIKRNRISNGSSRTFRVSPNQTTYDDSSALSGADYCYQVRSIGEPAASQYSNEACTSTDVLDAGFAVSDFHPVTGKVVEFTARRPILGSWEYVWRTSDEQTDLTRTAKFSFSNPGIHSVILVVSAGGETKASSVTLNVQASNQGAGDPGTSFSLDPVNLATGNYIYEHVDLRLQGIGLPFEFKRFYNSKFSELSGFPLGYGWTHSYNILLRDLTTNVLVVFGDGRTESYALDNSGYRPEPGVYSRLVKQPDGSWRLTSKGLIDLNFSPVGRLLTVTDRNRNTLSLTYANEVLEAIRDTVGREITFASNPAGRLETLRDPLGRLVRFEYDEYTNLVAVVNTRGHTNWYQYDEEHRLTNGIAPNGVTYVANVYDPDLGIVLAQHDALTNWTWFHYDFENRITWQTNALGDISQYSFDHRLLTTNVVDERGYTNSYAYDEHRNRILVRDPRGHETHARYDDWGNLTNRTDALGGVTEFVFNTRNDPIAQRDALGYWTEFDYDDRGNLVATTNALGHVVRIIPGSNGLPLLITDARGFTTTNVYDAQGLLVGIINPLGYTNQVAYDAAGRRTNVVDALGRMTVFELDAADNVVQVVDSLGYSTTNTFDENGNQFFTRNPRGAVSRNFFDFKDRLDIVENALGHRWTNLYNALDRRIGVIDARGYLTRFEHDSVGNLTNVINPLLQAVYYEYDPSGNQTKVTDAEGHTTVRNYDALNRPFEVINALGNVSRTGYDALGRIVAITNANNHITLLNRDALGRLTNVVDAAGGNIHYDYDKNGNRVLVINPNGHSWTYSYDALNRLQAEFDALGHETRFAYDAAGNLTNKLTANGITISYAYNARNELTNIAYSTGGIVAFALDAGGLRTNMVDRLGVTSWKHDDLGRLESVTDAFGQTVETKYDQVGNRILLRYPGGREVGYAWNEAGRLSAFTNWLGSVTVHSYDRRGLLTNILHPNAIKVITSYDPLGRVAWHTNMGPAGPIGGYSLTYDSVGNLTNQLHVEPLVPLIHSQTNTYSYDSDNRLTSANGQVVVHDRNGNLTHMGSDTLIWDAENRLTSFNWNGVKGNAEYDGLGVRFSLRENEVVRRFLVDRTARLPEIVAETDINGVVRAYYVYGSGLSQRISSSGVVQVYLYDPQGSTVAITDSSGAITDAYSYLPFGEEGDYEGTTVQPFQYLGRYGIFKENSGLYFARARYWFPELGRFASEDPLLGDDGDAQSQNRYTYALNNPSRFVDLTGYKALSGDSAFYPSPLSSSFGVAHTTPLTYQGGGGAGTLPLHVMLTACGFEQSAIGAVCGVADGTLYLIEGQYIDAILSYISVIPVIGGVADYSKATRVAAKTAETFTVDAVTKATRVPDFIASADGNIFPVPRGATGPFSTRASGMQFIGGSGGPGLDPRVTGVRFMDPNATQAARAIYMNDVGQSVNPLNGRVVPKGDSSAHFYFNQNP